VRLVFVIAALLAAAIVVADAWAHFSSGLYSHRRGDCSSRVDPIGAVFYGPADGTTGGNLASAVNHAESHTGWKIVSFGSGQWFATHGYCGYWDGELASGVAWTTRHHMRLRRTYHADPGLGFTTVGTPHFETIESCGHVVRRTLNGVSGFDIARGRLHEAMVAGKHTSFYQYWGNTQPFVQCNGDVANSNGNVRFFYVPAWWHSDSGGARGEGKGETRTLEIRARGNSSLAAARRFTDFRLYFAGDSFEGLPLVAVERHPAQVSFLYGSCSIPVDGDGARGGCAPPLAVQVWPACDRDPSLYPFAPEERLRVRGVPAAFYEGHRRLELSTGELTVVLFGQERDQLMEAAAGLRGVNAPVPAFEKLPRPARVAARGRPSCP
jgi:hypothetical protein